MIDTNQSVVVLPGVGTAVAKRLERLGIQTVRDLLWHLPRTWLDLTHPQSIATVRRDEFAVIRAVVRNPTVERTSRRTMTVLRAELEDAANDRLAAVWFNQPFLASQLTEGSEWLFWGTPKYDFVHRQLQLASPKFAKSGGVLPIYPETDGLTSAFIRRLLDPFRAEPLCAEYLSASVCEDGSLLSRPAALKAMHWPNSIDEAQRATHRLAIDELVRLFLVLSDRRRERRSGAAPPIPTPVDRLRVFVDSLPFRLTDAQRRASWELLKDLERSIPMARLLLGDVGSGKTVVALIVAYAALLAGERVVWLAPTQLLAEQHVVTANRLLPSDAAAAVLVTASSKPTQLSNERFLIGTHALLPSAADLPDIGLVIIDEQHRFGVKQRQALLGARHGRRPHLLSMTATPIPRSLALTIFGDLDCSFLDQAPSTRKPTITRVIEPAQRLAAYTLVASELAAGRQAYVVCPNIDPATNRAQLTFDQDAQAVTKRFESLSADSRFAQFRIALLHGKLKAAHKQATMAAFARNEVQLLVATSLIEVGIDVPNATVLVIEGADRFGLAQLHQLRGRVGRGTKQSLCVAVADEWSPVAQQRLAAFAKSTNGFELAELDLQLRGPGDLIGDLQAGLPPLRLANLADTLLIDQARSISALLAKQAEIDPAIADQLAMFLQEENGGAVRSA